MSNEVFPSLPGVDIRVRRTVIPPAVTILTSPSEREFVGRSATLPRYEYELNFNVLRAGAEAELQQLVGFYNRHGGPFDSWLFKDPADHVTSLSSFGVGNGVTSQFQLVRTLGGFAEPIDALRVVPEVSVDGVPANVVINGSFEDNPLNAIATGWQPFNGGSAGTITFAPSVWSTNGASSQFVGASALAAGDGNFVGVYQPINAPFSGRSFSFGADFLVTPGRRISLIVEWFDASLVYLGGHVERVISSGVPVRLAFVHAAPIGAARANIVVYIDGGDGSSAELRVDSVQMQVGVAPATTYSSNVVSLGLGGVVTFNSPIPVGHALTWSGEFYRRCRFQGDRLDTTRFLKDLYDARQVRFISRKA